MDKKECQNLIKQLKQGKLGRRDIPAYVRRDADFLDAERKAKLRKPDKRGYDIIRNAFFVTEVVKYDEDFHNGGTVYFDSFDDYYSFLKGRIYERSCYFQCKFDDEMIQKYGLDLSKLQNTHLQEEQIDENYIPDEDEYDFDTVEKNKKLFCKWIDKFEACDSYEEFEDLAAKLEKSKCRIKSLKIIVSMLIEKDPEKAFRILIDVINHDGSAIWSAVEELCLNYGGQKVLDALDLSYIQSQSIRSKRRRDIKELANKVIADKFRIAIRKGFSKETHFYYIDTFYYSSERLYDHICKHQYFRDFESFSAFLENDLSDCDLSEINFDIDYSKYVFNERTRLPVTSDEVTYLVKKICRSSNSYCVHQQWHNQNGKVLKELDYSFEFFFDFAFFLNIAFAQSSLNILRFTGNTLCSLGNNALPSSITHIYVPDSLLNAYKTATNWSNYSSIIQVE